MKAVNGISGHVKLPLSGPPGRARRMTHERERSVQLPERLRGARETGVACCGHASTIVDGGELTRAVRKRGTSH